MFFTPGVFCNGLCSALKVVRNKILLRFVTPIKSGLIIVIEATSIQVVLSINRNIGEIKPNVQARRREEMFPGYQFTVLSGCL